MSTPPRYEIDPQESDEDMSDIGEEEPVIGDEIIDSDDSDYENPPVQVVLNLELSSESEDDHNQQEMRNAIPLTNAPLSPGMLLKTDPISGTNTDYIGYQGGRGGRGNVRRGNASRVRVRGPLVEKFPRDDDLSDDMKVYIRKLKANRNARLIREKRAKMVEDDEWENVNEENFYDTEDFMWESMDSFCGGPETFIPEKTGPKVAVSNAYEAFRCYWDDAILSHIATETNRRAIYIQSAAFRWYETNVDEILILFTFWMMLGIVRMPDIKSCFSLDPMVQTMVFRALFAERRYWNLNRAFHLVDNSSVGQSDPLNPISVVLNHLNKKFKENYTLSQEICIDESLVLWKGPLKFKQYMKLKAAKFGIKLYELCDSRTGYLWSCSVYQGRTGRPSAIPSSVSTVLKLVEPVLNLGHVLYMDNWFNSPSLARFLKRRHTDCVGILRNYRKHVPEEIRRAPLMVDEYIARHSGGLAVVAFQDKKRVTMLSTFHDMTQIQKPARPGRPSHYKLKIVEDYNRGMGGVDRLDQMLEPYLIERKQCRHWSKKLFKRLLNITIQNARILLEQCTNSKISSLGFRLDLARAIMEKHLPGLPRAHSSRRKAPSINLKRLTERHFARQGSGRKRCILCQKSKPDKNVRSSYECQDCNVALCLIPCFEHYHTIP